MTEKTSKKYRQLQTCRELMQHLNGEYYQRTDQSSLDVHFICEELIKLAQMKNNLAIVQEEISKVGSEVAAWMINQEPKFKTK